MDTLYIITKIIVSLLFFVASAYMVYLCFKAQEIETECARIEKLLKEDIYRIYQTGSMATKVIIELVLARYSFNIGSLLKF